MVLRLNFSIEGEQQVARRFNKVPKELGNIKPLLFRIGREIRISVDANFNSRGALFGEKWVPRKNKKPWPLLEKTGKMRRGFQQTVTDDYVEIFNITDYFKYHQSNKPRTKIPRRVMLKIDNVRKVFIVKQFQKHIQKALKEELF